MILGIKRMNDESFLGSQQDFWKSHSPQNLPKPRRHLAVNDLTLVVEVAPIKRRFGLSRQLVYGFESCSLSISPSKGIPLWFRIAIKLQSSVRG